MLVLSGEVEVCVEGNIYNLEEVDLVLINSNEGHASLKHKALLKDNSYFVVCN